jgi:Tfp pilus assembly protein PilN
MMMQNVDFLPDKIRQQRRRRRKIARQLYMTAMCLALLGALGYVRQGSISSAQAQLREIKELRGRTQAQLVLRKDLEHQQEELQIIKRIHEELGSRVNALEVLAELENVVPANVSLTTLSIEAVEIKQEAQRPAVRGGSGRPVAAPRSLPTVKRVRLMITGMAPNDVDVANCIGQLSASPVFEDVNMSSEIGAYQDDFDPDPRFAGPDTDEDPEG